MKFKLLLFFAVFFSKSFLYSLLNINGISKDHWLAQSRLSAPILDEKSNALIFLMSVRIIRYRGNGFSLAQTQHPALSKILQTFVIIPMVVLM